MKKQTPQLTTQEKIKLVDTYTRLMNSEIGKERPHPFFTPTSIIMSFLLGLAIYKMSPILGIITGSVMVVHSIIYSLVFYLKFKKEILSVSKNLTYKNFKKLEKSGEIAKWQQNIKKLLQDRIIELEGATVEEYKTTKQNELKPTPNKNIVLQKNYQSKSFDNETVK